MEFQRKACKRPPLRTTPYLGSSVSQGHWSVPLVTEWKPGCHMQPSWLLTLMAAERRTRETNRDAERDAIQFVVGIPLRLYEPSPCACLSLFVPLVVIPRGALAKPQ